MHLHGAKGLNGFAAAGGPGGSRRGLLGADHAGERQDVHRAGAGPGQGAGAVPCRRAGRVYIIAFINKTQRLAI